MDKENLNVLKHHPLPWVSLAYYKFFIKSQDPLRLNLLQKKAAEHPLVKDIIKECLKWPGYSLKRHNDAKHIIQKIGVLADMGLDRGIKEIDIICRKLMERSGDSGAFLSEILIPQIFGGNNKAEWNWIICDFPLITEALISFGFKEDPRVLKAVQFLKSLVEEKGWLCKSSYGEKFKGPGKKSDPCPIANLFALRVLGLCQEELGSLAAQKGIEMLLDNWENRRKKRYFLFGMGQRFKKLKYPFVWFDILNFLDTLSLFPSVYKDKRYLEICKLVFSKGDDHGWYTPESVWMAYKEFDFGQKKEPSPLMTLAVLRIKRRMGLL